MQIQRLAVVSRDEAEILGYQLQVTATKEEWETVKEWADAADSALLYWEHERNIPVSKSLKTLNDLLMDVING